MNNKYKIEVYHVHEWWHIYISCGDVDVPGWPTMVTAPSKQNLGEAIAAALEVVEKWEMTK